MIKSLLNISLLFLFFFLGLQVPQTVENYKIGASAVVAELEDDYNKISNIAKIFNLTIEQLMEEAKKTQNIYAKKIVGIQAEKIPRYLVLKEQVKELQVKELNGNSIFNSIKIVFFKHDAAIWQNVKNTFQIGVPLNLDSAWYIAATTAAVFLVLVLNLLWLALVSAFSGRKTHRYNH